MSDSFDEHTGVEEKFFFEKFETEFLKINPITR